MHDKACVIRASSALDDTSIHHKRNIMQFSLLVGALALNLVTPLVLADSTSSQTSTYSNTIRASPSEPAYSSTKTEQQLDEHGNVIKKTETDSSKDPATGDINSSSSTSVVRPDGSTSTVEKAHSSDGTYGGRSTTEKRTTTTSP